MSARGVELLLRRAVAGEALAWSESLDHLLESKGEAASGATPLSFSPFSLSLHPSCSLVSPLTSSPAPHYPLYLLLLLLLLLLRLLLLLWVSIVCSSTAPSSPARSSWPRGPDSTHHSRGGCGGHVSSCQPHQKPFQGKRYMGRIEGEGERGRWGVGVE